MKKSLLKNYSSILFSILFLTSSAVAEDIPDPIEPINRGIFWFNNTLDENIIEPIAKGYDYITPDPVQRSIRNFFINLNTPVYLVSDILQLKFGQSATHLERFAINSTVGVLGLLDVANDWGIPHHDEDLGSAFGYWGVGPGAYIVLPLLGPSSLRDGIGFAGESFLSPTIAVTYSNLDQADKNLILGGANTLRFINIRSRLIPTIQAAKEASLDYYSFIKHAYQQDRQAVIYDGLAPEEDDIIDYGNE